MNAMLYGRLQEGNLRLPWLVNQWYRCELAFFYGRAGEKNLGILGILSLGVRLVASRIARKVKGLLHRATNATTSEKLSGREGPLTGH